MEVRDMATSASAIKLPSILGVSALIFVLDWFYLVYTSSKGFDLKTQTFMIGSLNVSIPLQWLPVFGVVLLSAVTWYEAYYRIFPRRGIEVDPMARLRFVRAIVFSLTLFVLFLYVPALVRSGWFWTSLSEAGKSIAQVREFGNWLLSNLGPLIGLDLLWQYSASQTFASALLVLGAWAFARTARRVRK
jgi:uncharacterized membrane protein